MRGNMVSILVSFLLFFSLAAGCRKNGSEGQEAAETSQRLSMAIDGNGFFLVCPPNTSTNYYTKLGDFTVNSKGYLVNPQGYIVQGWQLVNGENSGTIKHIQLADWSGTNSAAASEISCWVASDGVISMSTALGSTDVYRIALSKFSAPYWLEALPDHLYSSTQESGPAITDSPGAIGMGTIIPDRIGEDLTLGAELFPYLSINGNGYFILSHMTSPQVSMYTHTAIFQCNRDGYLVTTSGPYRVQGWILDQDTGVPVGELQDVRWEDGSIAPLGTSRIDMSLSLDRNIPNETNDSTLFNAWDGSNLGEKTAIEPEMYDYSSSIDVINILGNIYRITTYWDRTTYEHEWEFLVSCSSANDFRALYPNQKGSGALMYGIISFDALGNMIDLACYRVPPSGRVDEDWDANRLSLIGSETSYRFTSNSIQGSGGAGDQSILFDISAQESGSSSTILVTQDGYEVGWLVTESVNEHGVITLQFSNGINRSLWQLALAWFENPAGLELYEDGIYTSTQSSGAPIVDVPGADGLGLLISSRS